MATEILAKRVRPEPVQLSEIYCIRMTVEQAEALELLARRTKRTKVSHIRDALDEYLASFFARTG